MSALVWTIALVGMGVTGLYFAPKHWWGWAINACSEFLWFAYAVATRDLALGIMASCFWFPVNVRNAVKGHSAHRREVEQQMWREFMERRRGH